MTALKIATWNVNSIKARADHVTRWLERVKPDVLMIQELKGLEFPPALRELGYHVEALGQKAYNGVALLSRSPVSIVRTSILEGDEHARYIEADLGSLRLINIYLPNGNPAPGDKFDYKLRWMDALIVRVKELRHAEIPFLIGGDFNVIPEGRDCYDPKAWEGDALFRMETRQRFRTLLNLGLTDAFRALNQKESMYTFWDYFAGSWEHDRGIRIDHFLLSPAIADRLESCVIDKAPRAEPQPSDHTPVILTLKAAA